MKKILFLSVILLASCTVALAQPRAIGGRLGWSIGPSYQHHIGKKTMIQADVDFMGYGLLGVQGTVTFNWLIPLVSANAGNLNIYPGVGIGGGCDCDMRMDIMFGSGFVGVAGMVGLEWNFKFPLQLSVEYRPLIGTQFYKKYYHWSDKSIDVAFYRNGLWASAIALGVRYRFGGK